MCPEVEIGLGTPRDPIRIYLQDERKSLYQPGTRKHLTQDMNAFSGRFLASLEEVDGFILKAKSPSCAITDAKIFPSPASTGHIAQGSGLFAGAALEKFSKRAFVDEAGLNEPGVRAGFLTKIFTLAGFREVKKSGRAARLVRYHAENKLLFMAYHQETMREMGRIAANHENRAFGEVVSAYESALLRLLAHPPARASYVNALAHAMGHFIRKNRAEKKRVAFSIWLDTIPGGENPAGRSRSKPCGNGRRAWTRSIWRRRLFLSPIRGCWGVGGSDARSVIKILLGGRYAAPTVWKIRVYD